MGTLSSSSGMGRKHRTLLLLAIAITMGPPLCFTRISDAAAGANVMSVKHPARIGTLPSADLLDVHDPLLVVGPNAVREPQWITHGQGIQNWRNQVAEERITAATVSALTLRWTFRTGFDVSATPSISDKIVYFPSWNGYLYAVHAETGVLIWSRSVAELAGVEGANSRATPVIYQQYLLVSINGPAMVVALDRQSGDALWRTVLEARAPLAVITMSGTPFEGYYYVGTSSYQETAAVPPNCCTFIGSFAKLEIASGTVVWQTYMLPDNLGQQGQYSGAAIWGSSPAIDRVRRQVYIATGNLYSAPEEVEQCELEQQQLPVPEVPDPCIEPENRANAMIALDLDTGAFKWTVVLGGYSAWTYACLTPGNPNCPAGPGTDYDFGEAPMIITVGGRDLVVAGQKSGTVWALDPDNGDIVWSTVAGPGGFLGGAIWGSCTDGKAYFTNIANSQALPWTLVPSNAVVTWGGWVAIDLASGAILWSTADPLRGPAFGPPSCTNDVVFVTSAASPEGAVYALSAQSGEVTWCSDDPDASIYGGFSIAYGCAYVGEGYSVFPDLNLTSGDKVFAFCYPEP